jgi:cytochrome c oxidase subunit 2
MSGVTGFDASLLLATGTVPGHEVSIFEPASPAAASIVQLAILVFAVAILIFLVVEGVLFYSIARFRERRPPDPSTPPPEPPQVYGSNPIEIAWTVAPTLIVFFLVLVAARTLWEVNAAPIAPKDSLQPLEVTVIARQWWWEYQYKSYDGRALSFTTANELHIPASSPDLVRPTRLTLKSADVCHSYWIPRLEGKVDVIPGRTNYLWLQTTEEGLYLGQCAEYCGTQHAHMLLRVVVQSPVDFEAWLEAQSQPAAEDPAAAEGRAAFLSESCVNCHRIRGTAADGNYAPDLTHLMSRQTLASGMVPLDEDHLRRWVHDPQSIKPGCLMPAFGLSADKEVAIVRYLLTLK